jgi:hypothetical protein
MFFARRRSRAPIDICRAAPLLVAGLLGLASAPALAQGTAAAQHDQHQAPADQGDYPSLKISGFGDVDFAAIRPSQTPRGFFLGQLTLHMVSALSPRVAVFGELTFTPRTDAGTGSPPATGFNAEVERLIIRFDRSDYFKISAGRYHTPINWWNTAFHHGQWLQTTITRPEMIQFGGKLLPVHFVGALVEGSVPAGGLNVNYQAGVGNGRGAVISRAGDAGDVNDKAAFVFNGFIHPDKLYALQAGGSFYTDQVNPTAGGTFHEHIYSGHVVWTKEEPELIAEVVGIRHEAAGSTVSYWTHAYYAQAAYRIPQLNHVLKPYVRFEHIAVPAADAAFAGVLSLDMTTAGLRYDASTYAAIKGEYRTWTRGPGTARIYGGFFQVCFTF